MTGATPRRSSNQYLTKCPDPYPKRFREHCHALVDTPSLIPLAARNTERYHFAHMHKFKVFIVALLLCVPAFADEPTTDRPKSAAALSAGREYDRAVELAEPVGIEGNITRFAGDGAAWDAACSTPVGIEGNITRPPGQPVHPGPSAQRLSASKGTSQAILSHSIPIRPMCSTPVGIEGNITARMES